METQTIPGTRNQPPELDLASLGRVLTEHAPLPMATVDGSRHIVRYANPPFCRLIGKPERELVGKPFAEKMLEKGGGLALLDRVYRTGTPDSHTAHEPAESWPVVRYYTMWPIMAEEHPVGVMIQVTDSAPFQEATLAMNEALIIGSVHQHELTEAAGSANVLLQNEIGERQRVEDALRRAQAQLSDHAGQLEGLVAERTAELTATNQQLEAFVYSIAHDLRAPLRSMQGFSALMLGDAGTVLSDKGRDFADRIDRSAQFMDAMLRDLLAFSRISQQDVELNAVNLAPVVESVLARLQNEILEKNARIEITGPWPAVLAHDPTLAQLLFNLMSNALKFIVPGVPPLVRLWTEERAEFIRVWVEDNGPGIAPDHQDQIFRLFNRLHGGKYPGTGIGLAIVKKGAERMGGRVGVESAAGQGSRFWFELPKATPAAAPRRSGIPW